MEQPKNFLEKLQTSDEAVKQRWLVGSAVVIMTIVVFLWLAYFNSFVIDRRGTPAIPAPGPEANSAPFLGTMKNGAIVLYRGFLGKLWAFGKILEAPREYIIRPPQ